MPLKPSYLAAICVMSLALPAWAHHSHGNYVITNWTNLEGTVTEYHWINPHTWIYIEVEDDQGQTTLWALEGAAPGQLARDGWKRDDVKVGDTIKVRCHRLRDGGNGCLLGWVTPQGWDEEKEWD